MRLALFQHIDHEWEPRAENPAWEVDAHDYGYVRVSEYIDVEFPALDPATKQQQMVAIDRYESSRRESFDTDMRVIIELRAKLSAS